MTDTEKLIILRRGIEEYLTGEYNNPRKYRESTMRCGHGIYYWEACEACTDAHFAALIERIDDPDPEIDT